MWMGRQNELLPTSYASQLSEHTITGFEPQSSLSTMVSTEAATVGSAIAPQVGAIIPAPPSLTMASSISAQLQAAGKSMSSPRPEVVCPLPNPDGSGCRKKCSGTFAYRSICEHIRRAHPDHWIPRLPASAESFRKMIETPPTVKEPTVYSGPSTTGGTAMNIPTSAGSSRKSTGGTGGRARTKAASKSKASVSDEQFNEDLSPSSSAPESDAVGGISIFSDLKQPHEYEIPQSNVPSETGACIIFFFCN
ncbi:hypothetical protein DFH27DRAFT_85164 [Peziza echinospora]|nr:hypothetical protein DFH27DRAFT_85164 [Peziza echinospora]